MTDSPPLSEDLLRGADEIAAWAFGHAHYRRRVYRLVESGRIPIARMGGMLVARKSVINTWLEQQMQQAR